METMLKEAILSKKIDFVEYSFSETGVEGNDYSETLSQIRETRQLYRGNDQGVHYYGFRFKEQNFYLCLDNREKEQKFIIYNFTQKSRISIAMKYEVMADIVMQTKISATKNLNMIHEIQNKFVTNWKIMFVLVVIASLLTMIKIIKLDIVSVFITYVALILALEDSFTVLAKRFQRKIRRIEMIIVIVWMVLLELLSIILVICSIFIDDILLVLGDFPTIIGIVTTLGVLLIRKDALSKI